jgi:Flp pilus assembly protein TadG
MKELMIAQPAHKLERGQALPLLALALIALAGFAALALDGGNLYTEQRRAQAAADNAVMAAAFQQMNGITGTVTLANAAFNNATQNGYTNGAHTSVVFHWPPVDGPYHGNKQYMEVVITQTVPTALAHLVYQQDPIPVTVFAVAHGSPTGPLMPGYALAAMKPDCTSSNGTIYVEGNGGGNSGGTVLTDGGAFVNSTCSDALDMTGNHELLVTNGPPIDVVGGARSGWTLCSSSPPPANENCNYIPAPTTGFNGGVSMTQDPLHGTPAATPPVCGPAQASPSGGGTIQPGSYTSLDSGNHALTLLPGIYCLTGGSLHSKGNVTGTGVMIYLVDTPAKIDFSGQGTINLTAPAAGTSTATPAEPGGCTGNTDTSQVICKYLGIVVYKLNGANTCSNSDHEIDFTGQANMTVTGLLYAPLSFVRYGGSQNASLTMEGQTIAGCVKFNGNGNINIVYEPKNTYSPPPSVRLDE